MDKKLDQFTEAHYRAWHLAESQHEATTTEFEWGILRYQQAFERWITQLANITGMGDLSYIEIIIIHVIRMQERPKTAADIARQLNRDDIPNIQYCLRKLVKSGLVQKTKDSKNKVIAFEVTPRGKKLTDNYAELRKQILTEQTMNIEDVDEKLIQINRLISLMTGLYDEASRITATYSPIEDGSE